MRATPISRSALICFSIFSWVVLSSAWAQAAEAKVEVQLIWATNDNKSPDPNHKAIEESIRKKLEDLPLKWTNYFVVKKDKLTVPRTGSAKATMSEKCSVEVRDQGKSMFEVSLIGKGQQVVKRSQSLPQGETLVLGGNAPNATAWLVVFKRLE